jgi:hypothetical protein
VSGLAEAVVQRLAKKNLQLSVEEVNEILSSQNVPASVTKAVPVPLRVTRIKFSGTKQLKPDHPDAAGQPSPTDSTNPADRDVDLFGNGDPDDEDVACGAIGAPAAIPLVPVPFVFDWVPRIGVNGIGSGKNLRGKSTVLNVLMWALTGRCAHFQPDIRDWIERVLVEFAVSGEGLRVAFDAVDGVPTGVVECLEQVGEIDRVTPLGQFDTGQQFEDVMGQVMMSRLRLERIPVWTSDRAVPHEWPAYSSAFTVRANALDPIVGNETTIGVRMMQMFVGTEWAPASASVTTARRRLETERDVAQRKAVAAGEAVRTFRDQAQGVVDEIRAKIAALPLGTPDVQKMLDATTRASELSRELHALETHLLTQSGIAETVRQQLRVVKARLHTEYEDALATKFFHRMRPTVCPRCASAITEERHAAEPDRHECSVCSSDLNLEALKADVIVSASVSDEVASSLVATAAHNLEHEHYGDGEDDDGEDVTPTDEVEALEAALRAADDAAAALTERISERSNALDAAVAEADAGGALVIAADERRRLDLDLARAEGALAALTRSSDPVAADPVDPTIAAVLEASEKVIKEWVKKGQDPLLAQISVDIERLAVSFGADSLSNIKLDGAANMTMLKGGKRVSYKGITEGEKLRVKIATAIALIKHGYVEGVGRHPGLLVLDSPTAEEMPEEDLATMVESLKAVAEEAEMQIFVATRNAGPLISLLPKANRVVAAGDAYVW